MEILALCKTPLPIQMLDVGCSEGYLVKLLRERGIEILGVDISESCLNNAPNDIKPFLYKVNVEYEILPFQGEFFNFIMSMSTFEHLHINRLYFTLSEIHRVLKPKGLLIINMPSPFNKFEATVPGHITMLRIKEWISFIEKKDFNFESKLSQLFDVIRVKEIVNLYMSSDHSFQFMNLQFRFPYELKTLITNLMLLRRKLFAPNFSLIFSRG